jgi:hypothetical protein
MRQANVRTLEEKANTAIVPAGNIHLTAKKSMVRRAEDELAVLLQDTGLKEKRCNHSFQHLENASSTFVLRRHIKSTTLSFPVHQACLDARVTNPKLPRPPFTPGTSPRHTKRSDPPFAKHPQASKMSRSNKLAPEANR